MNKLDLNVEIGWEQFEAIPDFAILDCLNIEDWIPIMRSVRAGQVAQTALKQVLRRLDQDKALQFEDEKAWGRALWKLAYLGLSDVYVNDKRVLALMSHEAHPGNLQVAEHLNDIYRFDAIVYVHTGFADFHRFLDGDQASLLVRPLYYLLPEHFDDYYPEPTPYLRSGNRVRLFRKNFYHLSEQQTESNWENLYQLLRNSKSQSQPPDPPENGEAERFMKRYDKYSQQLEAGKIPARYVSAPEALSVDDYMLLMQDEKCATAFFKAQQKYEIIDVEVAEQVVSESVAEAAVVTLKNLVLGADQLADRIVEGAESLYGWLEAQIGQVVAFRSWTKFSEQLIGAAAGGSVHLPESDEDKLLQVDNRHDDINIYDLTFSGQVISGETVDITIRSQEGDLPEDAVASYLLWKMPSTISSPADLIKALKDKQSEKNQPELELLAEQIYAGPSAPTKVQRGRIRIKDDQVPAFRDGSRILLLIKIEKESR